MFKVFSETQPVFNCSKLTIKTLEQGAKYMFKVNNKDTKNPLCQSLF